MGLRLDGSILIGGDAVSAEMKEVNLAVAGPRALWLAELVRPLPHGLVADDAAAYHQQFLDHAQAEREAKVQPDCMLDDQGREAMAAVRE
jgi:hypothetical protein